MAAISKVMRLYQNLRGAEPPTLTLCIGFVGRRFQKESIAKYIMPLYPPFWKPFSQKWRPFFKVIRVIFENMRQIIVTLVSTYIIFREYYSDSILLRASHNGGLNLAGCCGNLFYMILDITDVKSCRICKCVFTFNKYRE